MPNVLLLLPVLTISCRLSQGYVYLSLVCCELILIPMCRLSHLLPLLLLLLCLLQELCADPGNVVVIFSGSETTKLEETFADLPVWLAAENGVYIRPPPDLDLQGNNSSSQDWICLFDTLPKEWMESVQLVFDYFSERTPRSFVETRETSLVWNYKHADVEFGRLQARDLLQVTTTYGFVSCAVLKRGLGKVFVRGLMLSKLGALFVLCSALLQRTKFL